MKNGWAQLLRSKRGTAGVVTRSATSDFRLLQQTSFWLRDLELSGSCVIALGTSAALSRVRALSGTCAITLNATAVLARLRELTGSCTIAAGTSGTVERVRALAGTCAASTTFTGALSRVRELSGLCAIVTTLTGTLSIYSGPIFREMTATVSIHSGFTGTLERLRSLSGTCAIILTPSLGTLQRIRVRQVVQLTVIVPAANSLTACTGGTPVTLVASPVVHSLAGLPV